MPGRYTSVARGLLLIGQFSRSRGIGACSHLRKCSEKEVLSMMSFLPQIHGMICYWFESIQKPVNYWNAQSYDDGIC